jgi:hypothetical protein
MPGFASYDDLINETTTNGKSGDWDFFKIGSAMQAAGSWHRLWIASGSPGAGAEPAGTPGTSYTLAAGSINFPNVSTDQRYMLTLGATATQNCVLMVYDRLVAVGAISSASTGAKTINSAGLPRYAAPASANVQCWLEVTTASTTTQCVCAMNQYTNEAGTTGRAGGNISWPAAATVKDCMIGPMPLQVGDKGVTSVQVGINIVTANTAGVFNVVLLRPLAFIPLIANQWTERDMVLQLASLGAAQCFDGASISLAVLASGTTALNCWGKIRTGYG